MGLFSKKPKRSSANVLDTISGKPIRYVSERDENSVETIIGRNGLIEISDGSLRILCDGACVFCAPVGTVEVLELQSRGGARISGLQNGAPKVVTVFFTLFNK